MRVYEPGTIVNIRYTPFKGRILKVCIYSEDYVKYQIVWWKDEERKVEWLNYNEINGNHDSDTIRIDYE